MSITLGTIRPARGIAGGVAYSVHVTWTMNDGEVGYSTDVTFVGSTYGAPGPVVVIGGGAQTFVSEPGRFGETFDPEWIRRFYAE